LAARNRERNNDPVALIQIADGATRFNNLTHELVSENITVLHGWDVASVNVKVGSANRG
jgi:hypothetical protein